MKAAAGSDINAFALCISNRCPLGITIASAVANSSSGPWTVARLPPATAMEPNRRMAVDKPACRISSVWCGAFSNDRGTSVGSAILVQHQLLRLDSRRGLAAGATELRAGWEDAATPMKHQRESQQGELVLNSAPAMPKRKTR